ncbi:hypothetical protein SPRG_05499 [Saprolegnia parasitica CBS 223.65]|uniref:Superoxide dismutase copper/zinc binding domain-containing protein n=1 Tax=Saprolegnia parasitica (strain CBS 223.65) TaxID=695850 RepID=A0A067CGA1_SAPPC|nr:hypothetical protein SPRG_05499 [Saprolegnia parasitica CBS 223.65]KDO29543.1 hypothetical protein SPRG_05499 [Saprolegnia parasitica CBS 223.65]|eukprot:XP_012199608.1 hypothetical protein SPRG_05499 [Saprolegnia parasitica CBS 223.65]
MLTNSSATNSSGSHTTTYSFAPATSAGVSGTIMVTHLAQGAKITANLDVSGANWTALSAADGNCTGPIESFTWHIHTKWTNKASSASLSGCSLAATSNHYDPTFACGPNSEYIATDTCKPVVAEPGFKYDCSPASYAAKTKACEEGDLSGKLGKMTVKSGKIEETWTDMYYPSASSETPQWNMMLHAVCGKATPRFICATAAGAGGNGSAIVAPTTAPGAGKTPTATSSTSTKATTVLLAALASATVLF